MPGRPLMRPHYGRAIAGVCVGLAQAYGWDVALVRIATVVGFFFSGGIVAIAYLACWIGIPEEPIGLPTAPVGTASWRSPSDQLRLASAPCADPWTG